MILSFRCSPALKQKVDRLLERGLFPDFSTFCEVALENQVLLEQNAGPVEKRAQVRLEKAGPKGTPIEKLRNEKSAELLERLPKIQDSLSGGAAGAPRSEPTGVPEELLLTRIASKAPFSLPDASPDIFGPRETIPVDRWLFGQYNRLLPAKVSVRGLCAIASGEGKGSLKLDSASARVAETAAAFGDYLRLLDAKIGAHRDEALSTAFPESGADGQKGRVRYQNHFVAQTVKGEQGGLLVALKLAALQVFKNKPCVMPTNAGWEFALLENPILDGSIGETSERFSESEKTFLLQHIKNSVPVERFSYSVILDMLVRDVVSPEAMNSELFQLLSAGRDSGEAKEFVNTQRSGVLGRMTDLGLIVHERNGRNVNRTITAEGKKFLEVIKKWSLVVAS